MRVRATRPRSSDGTVNSLILLTVFMLAYVAAIGAATVWLRHQISVTANANRLLEVRLGEVQRRIGEAAAEVAFAQSPEQLMRRNLELGLNLVRPREEQVIRATEDVERRLAARRFGRLFLAAEEPRGNDGGRE